MKREVLTAEAERELVIAAQAGDRSAAGRLLMAHVPLVQRMLRERGVRRTHTYFADLEQEAFRGLLEALRRFDPARETRFCTYAQWWLRHYVNSARNAWQSPTTLGHTRALRRVRLKLGGAQKRAQRLFGRAPSREELAEAIGLCTAEDVFRIERERSSGWSVPVEHGDAGVSERTADGYILATESSAELELERTQAARFLDRLLEQAKETLSEREHMILVRLHDEQAPALRDLGAELSISGERVRQIKNAALRKLQAALEPFAPEAHEALAAVAS